MIQAAMEGIRIASVEERERLSSFPRDATIPLGVQKRKPKGFFFFWKLKLIKGVPHGGKGENGALLKQGGKGVKARKKGFFQKMTKEKDAGPGKGGREGERRMARGERIQNLLRGGGFDEPAKKERKLNRQKRGGWWL